MEEFFEKGKQNNLVEMNDDVHCDAIASQKARIDYLLQQELSGFKITI